MFKLFSILLLLSFSFADTNVFSGESIQDAIDNAPAGETIIVHDGTYTENLLIEKDLILRSENGRDVTTISGHNETNGSNLGSTIVVRPPSRSSVSPDVEINGFNIINGKGSTIYSTISSPYGGTTDVIKKVGGGLVVCKNSPTVINNKFQNNGNTNTAKGGAVYAASDTEDCDWSTRDYVNPLFEMDETPLDFSNNIFLENNATEAKSVYIIGYEETTTDLTNGYFDVYSDDLEGSSGYWIHTVDSDTDEADGDGVVDAIAYNAYVNTVTGSDNNDGTTENTAFLTINHALSQVYASAENPMTIHLSGTYSPGITGAVFPIVLPSYVFIVGDDPSTSIIDAQGTTRVMEIINTQGNGIDNIQIRGGSYLNNSSEQIYGMEAAGGGIFCENSDPSITNSIIAYNEAVHGGGISISKYSNPYIYNVIIEHNTVIANPGNSAMGGGVFFTDHASGYLDNVIIRENSAGVTDINGATLQIGGGIAVGSGVGETSTPVIVNSLIHSNTGYRGAGGMFIINDNVILDNVDISYNISRDFSAFLTINADLKLTNSKISYNLTTEGDGDNTTFGGETGVYFFNNTVIDNCLITHNQSERLFYFWNRGNTILSNLTITDNQIDYIAKNTRYIFIANSIIWSDPDVVMFGINVLCYGVYNSNINMNFSDLTPHNTEIEENNINIDPLFNEDYTLQAGSPSIDMGAAYIEWEGQVIVDIPESDYYNTAPDMGAFEWWPEEVLGCMDELACNYNPDANVDDGSCIYPEENHDCDGNCLVELDCAGNCCVLGEEGCYWQETGPCGEDGPNNGTDSCGVCGGDNSSCADCAGVPCSNAYVDNCGVCDDIPENDCVQDCAGVWGGSLELDECGVCGGDNTSCQQLGDINGDGTINVIDIVMGVDLILSNNYDVVGDVNEDGQLNVIDIVMLVDWVLNGTGCSDESLWDYDMDGICDADDTDDDNDNALDPDDSDDNNEYVCSDIDGDNCDDCSSGTFDPTNDGIDMNGNGICDEGEANNDTDGDGVIDDEDSDPFNPYQCSDLDGDTCDDCSTGHFNPSDDGYDYDGDGQCDDGDCDDDNDGCQECWDYCP